MCATAQLYWKSDDGFFRPFLTFFFTPAEYDIFQGILEKREGIKRVIEEIEKATTIHRKDAKSAKGI